MQFQAHDIVRQLAQQPLPQIVLLFGDEPQQKLDIIDQIRLHVKSLGFDERQSFTLDADFEWAHLLDAMQSMSLFADKQYIELNLNTVKPGTAGAKHFTEIAQMDNPDVVLVINGPKAGKDVQKTKWFSALMKKAWFCHVYDLQGNQLQNWLANRAKQLSLTLKPSALSMLSDLCEGNLMAGRQELEKLALYYDASTVIDDNMIATAMVQQSRYSVFQFTDEILRGDMTRAVKMLGRLEDEGIEPVIILWNLVNEAQTLTALTDMQASQGRVDFKALRIWPSKQTLYQQALQRLSTQHMQAINAQLSQVDIMFKSTTVAKPFVVLSHLAMLFMPVELSEFSFA
ncbi:MAG: DNA polymerase III subunit delta [Glaciecola sp.]